MIHPREWIHYVRWLLKQAIKRVTKRTRYVG